MIDLDTLDFGKLNYDDGTIVLSDGRALRVRVEPDMHYDGFTDAPDAYGRIGVSRRHIDTGRNIRPADFDGNAEKLDIYNDVVWWQPPAGIERGSESFEALRDLVRDLASFGWKGVVVELLDSESDAYGRRIVREVASLWGIDSLDDGYLAIVARELADELELL